MKLNIFSSNTTITSMNAVIDFLARQNTDGSSHIVLVPDRYSLSVERDIYSRLELDGSFNIDVMSFSRLAARIEKKKEKFLSKEGTVMLLKKVIENNKSRLTYFHKVNTSIGFAKEMFAVIASLRNSGISSEQLKTKTEKMEETKRCKYLDIAILFEEYESELGKRYTDTISRLDNLFVELINNDWIRSSHIYILGFNIYSEKQKDIIKQLLLSAKSVSISAATDSGGGNKEIFPALAISDLVSFAEKRGIEMQNSYYFARLAPPFDTINKETFAFTTRKNYRYETNNVHLLLHKNPYEEIKAAAREISHLVKNGLRYRDISVVCCQQEYKKCLIDIFTRFGIPFFIDEKYSALESLQARYITSAIDVLLYNYRMDKLIAFAKHPYLELERREIEDFENYLLKYNINYSRFSQPFSLGEFAKVESIREKIVSTISQIKKEGFAADIADSILSLIEKTPEVQIGCESDLLWKASQQSQQKIVTLLEETKEILGDEKSDLEEFSAILIDGIAGMETALLPQYLDCVFIGNTAESRFSNVKSLFVVGANEGFFPLKTNEQTILSFSDLLLLQKSGLEVRPNPLESNKLEQFVVVDLLCKAENLYVSAASFGLLGEPMLYGEAIKELSYLLELEIKSEIHKDMDTKQRLLYFLANKENAFYEFAAGKIDEKYIQSVRTYLIEQGYEEKLLCIEKREDSSKQSFCDYFFPKDSDGNYLTKVTQLESYFSCPHMHYLRHGLKLTEREVATLRVADIGNIIHNILEYYFKENLNHLRLLSDEEIYNKSIYAIEKALSEEKYQSIAQDRLGASIITNIYNECIYVLKKLTENVKNSSFSPKYIELAFSDENSHFKAIMIDTNKGKFKFRGKIDRVDICENKVAIIDYKTGSANIGDLKDIYFGKKIQLYLYMTVFIDKGYSPAGAFYLPISDGYKSVKERFAFKGQVEDSPETLHQFDNQLFINAKDGEKYSSEILSVSVSMKNDSVKVNNAKNIIARSDFFNICSYVRSVAEGAIEEIADGNITKAPLEEECKYCAYKNHCIEEEIIERDASLVKIEQMRIGGEND